VVLVRLATKKVHKLVKCYAATNWPSMKSSRADSNRCHVTANGLRLFNASGSLGSRIPSVPSGITMTTRRFFTDAGRSGQDLQRLEDARAKSVQLHVTLWSRPYAKDELW
jgi:hypothetical protein